MPFLLASQAVSSSPRRASRIGAAQFATVLAFAAATIGMICLVAAHETSADVSRVASEVSQSRAAPQPIGSIESSATTSPAAGVGENLTTTELAAVRSDSQDEQQSTQPQSTSPPTDGTDAAGLKRLTPKAKAWLDTKHKRIVLVGEICLREGMLEMFACPKGTKEHEAIVAVDSPAESIHLGLLLTGAKPGGPVEFYPNFKPARGTEIEVSVFWTDENGKRQSAYAQDWIRNVRTRQALASPWVFAGSGFWEDEQTKERRYLAEDGDLICVSNFASAMLDLPIESSQSASQLVFEAFTDRIPPVGTKVTVVLTPKPEAEAAKK